MSNEYNFLYKREKMFFKSFVSKHQKSNGDMIWHSECGILTILIDAVSFSRSPSSTVKEIVYYLNESESILKHLPTSEIMVLLNKKLFDLNNEHFASVCILKHENNSLYFSSIGNTQFLEVSAQIDANYIIKPLYQPENILGQYEALFVQEESIAINKNSTYLLASDGIAAHNIDYETISKLKTNADWYNFANNNKNEDDWCFCIFPFEKQLSYENHNWPYFPFIGRQEEYEHEKDGLSKIADALFEDPDFFGFKILGGADISLKNSHLKMDGILISPYGVVLLELKDWYGDISIPIEGSGLMRAVYNGKSISDTSPIVKINKAMDKFVDWSIFSKIELKEKRIGAIIFTHNLANIRCVESSGDLVEDVYKVGNILISNIKDLPNVLKKYWKDDLSNSKKHTLSMDKINAICDNYLTPNIRTHEVSNKILLKNGKYLFSLTDIDENLSTDYYTL